MIYRFVHFGGPEDGQEVLGPRPLDGIEFNGHVYLAENEGERCLIWQSDDEYLIELHYQGRGSLREVCERIRGT